METFRIGDFCEKVGVSPDFLKYQEAQGIIEPYMRSDSNYRYYTVSHAGRVYKTLSYKSLGFSSREIKQIMTEMTSDEIMDMLSAKKAETERQILRLRRHVDHIRLLEKCRRCEEEPSPWYIQESGGYYFLPHFHRDNFLEDRRINPLIRQWMSYSPMVLSTQRILSGFDPQTGAISGDLDYYWGFLAEENFANEAGLPVPEPVIYIPPRRSLMCYQNIVPSDPSPNSWRALLKSFLTATAAATIKQCGLKVSGDIYNLLLFYSYEGGREHVHSQLIIPLGD